MGSLFEFVDVSVVAGDSSILRDVSTTIPTGLLTVIAGASGSGKTSLLRLCNRLDVPSAGRIRYRGADLASIDPLQLRRQVGMVFQRPVLFPGTVRENLATAATTATEAEMIEILRSVDLSEDFLERIGDDLSGGEGQRVCLARTLMCRPDVLLMDEPTASLHPAAARTLETTTQTLQRDHGVDVVWVTHDLSQIDRLAEHLIVLDEGRVAYAGTADGPQADAALASLSRETN